MKTIKISSKLVDVFTGDGWENWSRWEKSKTGFLKQVGGAEITGFGKAIIIKKLSEVK